MPATTDQASADPRLDRRNLALVVWPTLWESFAAGGATENQLAPPNPLAADCNALHSRRGHIAGCNNPPSGPSPVASRAGLLTNTLVHASSTLLLGP